MNFENNNRKDKLFGFRNNWNKEHKKKLNYFSTCGKAFKKSISLVNNGQNNWLPRPENSKPDLQKERKQLPIFGVRNQIIEAIKENDTIIFIGETASGKTTQIPQYILRSEIGAQITNRSELIAITQPRRVAAISVAHRVAQEMNTQVGEMVGYSIRFDENVSLQTKIKYMTDGMLLRESLNDSLMKKYGCVILDECHERSITTDVLFALVKSAQKQRKDKSMPALKIIVMSATMDVDHISQYFNNAPVVYLSGRQYPIKIYNSVQKQEDYIHSALVTVFQIHQNEPEGDILVFCTGREEIDSMVSIAKDTVKHLPTGVPSMTVFGLYASQPSSMQFRVFQKT
ncbi:putative ATP-dependent RNA helicase DHX33-like protein, partial [Leptotrombidium deliense]